MISYESIFKNMGESARAASLVLQQLPEERINDVLRAMAQALVTHTDRILEANHKDMESARDVVPDTMLDRLLLSKDRVEQMAEGVRQVSLLASPVGSVLESINRPNGLHIEKRNGKNYNNFPKSSENPVCHVRPHAQNSKDTYELPDGRQYPKQCFWLNNSYILSQLGKNFIED